MPSPPPLLRLAVACLLIAGCGAGHAAHGGPHRATLTPSLDRPLQARLRAAVTQSGAPGASAAIVFPDGREWTGVTGFADIDAKRAMTPSTAFPFAGVTELATAALILRLVEQDRLGLDDPIARWYRDWRGDPHATVRDLLGGTSGVGDPTHVTDQLFSHPRRLLSERRYLAAT